jgi:hypothetical protein
MKPEDLREAAEVFRTTRFAVVREIDRRDLVVEHPGVGKALSDLAEALASLLEGKI